MRIIAIDGSPRKKWNTSTILQNVLDGAAEARENVLTEMINLYDYNYKGCVECFECKRLGGPSYGKCAIRDDIQAILQNCLQADGLVFGTPIYFGYMTGMLHCFLERLLFPVFTYDKEHTSLAPKKFPVAFAYTMNVPSEMMETYGYPQRLAVMEDFASHIFGNKAKVLYVNNTLQFRDYSKYKMEIFSEAEKLAYREKHFPEACQKARELGAELAGAGLA